MFLGPPRTPLGSQDRAARFNPLQPLPGDCPLRLQVGSLLARSARAAMRRSAASFCRRPHGCGEGGEGSGAPSAAGGRLCNVMLQATTPCCDGAPRATIDRYYENMLPVLKLCCDGGGRHATTSCYKRLRDGALRALAGASCCHGHPRVAIGTAMMCFERLAATASTRTRTML